MKSQKAYEQWTNKRNEVLESIFNYYRLAISDRIRKAFSDIIKEFLISQHDGGSIDTIIAQTASDVSTLIFDMKQDVHDLTLASSLEIMSVIKGEKNQTNRSLVPFNEEMLSGGLPAYRVIYYLSKVTRLMKNQAERKALEKMPLTAEDLERCLPRSLKIAKARRPIKKLKIKNRKLTEADSPPDMSLTFIDDSTWDKILKGYKKEYVSPYRSNEFVVGKDQGGEYVYAWELERDLTDEFVKEIQTGQIEGFEKAGVKKFVWIAVLDNKTCTECCVWRDGLTTDEIARLIKGKRKKDKCQAISPPAHSNCRCTLAPAFDSLPERPKSNFKDFEEWLES